MNDSLLQDLDAAIEAMMKPAIFYLPVHHCPIEDEDGQPVVFGVQLPNVKVCVFHPSLESKFIDMAKLAGLRAVQFDYGKQCPPELLIFSHWWRELSMEQLKRQWKENLGSIWLEEGTND